MDTLNTETPVAPGQVIDLTDARADGDYWNALIDESEAAEFLGLARGTLANYRQAGTGPQFIRISARCIKYTRRLCKAWYDERVRSSTSDPGSKAAV